MALHTRNSFQISLYLCISRRHLLYEHNLYFHRTPLFAFSIGWLIKLYKRQWWAIIVCIGKVIYLSITLFPYYTALTCFLYKLLHVFCRIYFPCVFDILWILQDSPLNIKITPSIRELSMMIILFDRNVGSNKNELGIWETFTHQKFFQIGDYHMDKMTRQPFSWQIYSLI